MLSALGGVLLIAGLAFFIRPKWFLGWLKGMLVLTLLFAGGYTLVLALGLTQYRSLAEMETIATVSIQPAGQQSWTVRVQTPEGVPGIYSINGDQWQIDARIIRLGGPLAWLDLPPGYRLERLSGRYLSLEQERSANRSVIGLTSEKWPDLWALEQAYNLPFVEGVYGNATFMPMRADAEFDVKLSSTGLVAVPLNEPAREAVKIWMN